MSFGGPQLYNSEALPFTYNQYLVIESADKLYNSVIVDLFRYSYKVVEPEAPAAEESRSVAGRPVANIIQASAEKEVEEELAEAISEIEANDSAQSVELVEEEEEPVPVTQATPASYYYRFY